MKYASKAEFFERTNKEWSKLCVLIDSLNDADFVKHPEQRIGSMAKSTNTWSAKDILFHLHEWQNMAYGWYLEGLEKDEVTMPAKGYKWNQLPALNEHIYQQYKNESIVNSKNKLKVTHEKMFKLIESLDEKQFLESGYYKWTGKYSLSTYLASTLGAHYKWAHDTIKKGIKK